MRIISGKYKGRIIKSPKGIRPTEDRVRKAFFDIMGNIEGLSFLELFAGSGAMGLEAMSLGASRVVFVEKDRQCVKVIRDNLKSLRSQVTGQQGWKAVTCTSTSLSVLRRSVLSLPKDDLELGTKVIALDAIEAIKGLSKDGQKFDIIFLDPPYYPESRNSRQCLCGIPKKYKPSSHIREQSAAEKILQILQDYDILLPSAYIGVQHFKKDNLPEVLGNLRLFRQAKYGDTVLSFYKKDTRDQ